MHLRRIIRSYVIALSLIVVSFKSSTILAAGKDCRAAISSVQRLEGRDLVIMSWNVNNLFERLSEFVPGSINVGKNKKEIKPAHEIERVRNEIAEHMPDFGIFTEVENVKAMRRLLEEDPRLKNQYDVFLKNGNDSRGIDICLVVKKDLKVRVKFDTYKDLMWKDQGKEGPLFSRDLPVLRIYQEGDANPSLILMGNHAKSQRDRDGDPNSSRWRTAQYEAIAKISEEYAKKYPGVIQILAGDFNINVNTSKEIQAIRSTFISAYDLVDKAEQIPVEDRVTHWFFPHNGDPVKQQLDDIRIRGPVKIVKAIIEALKNRKNQDLEEGPQNYKERESLASDHAPLVVIMRILKSESDQK